MTLDEAIVELVNRTVAGMDETANFLAAEIPDVIHQLLVFKLTWHLISFTLCLSICIVVGRVMYITVKYLITLKRKLDNQTDTSYADKKRLEGAEIVAFAGCALGFLICVIPFMHIMSITEDILMIWLAPKIYLIEYARNLV